MNQDLLQMPNSTKTLTDQDEPRCFIGSAVTSTTFLENAIQAGDNMICEPNSRNLGNSPHISGKRNGTSYLTESNLSDGGQTGQMESPVKRKRASSSSPQNSPTQLMKLIKSSEGQSFHCNVDEFMDKENKLMDDVYHKIQQPIENGDCLVSDVSIPYDSEMQPVCQEKKDSSCAPEYYIEETAWRLHNPTVPHCSQSFTYKQLYDQIISKNKKYYEPTQYSEDEIIQSISNMKPLPPAPPLPEMMHHFPSTGYCVWSSNPQTRVIHADFRPKSSQTPVTVTEEDENFLLLMMERDDITVISSGLMNSLDPQLWGKKFMCSCVGNDIYHRFRSFRRVLKKIKEEDEEGYYITYEENDKWLKLTINDYFRYLDQRKITLEKICARRLEAKVDPTNPLDEADDLLYRKQEEEIFEYEDLSKDVDHKKRKLSFNCVDQGLYMIDYDLGKLFPKLKEDFVESFGLKGLLPGGANCMMNYVNEEGRPFMGPNLYLTPPASFTHFHQDGHGTVDSGHACLSGYNEVIMMRRLTETHKRHALFLLYGGTAAGVRDKSNFDMNRYDALYGQPHEDGHVGRPSWPTYKSIKNCEEMNYYPSVFVLKPGQFVHINKGRLHAFRKLSPATLPKSDCHHLLRQHIKKTENLGYGEQICMSVAWDWMYTGITSYGINREISSILECSRLNRDQLKQSLAIPETCVIQMAKALIAAYDCLKEPSQQLEGTSLIPFKSRQYQGIGPKKSLSISDTLANLQGIFASFKYIVSSHKNASISKKASGCREQRVSIAKVPNTWENPELTPLDPYGSGDFFCKLCYEELSNIYLHCDGCENILKKDFNICVNCHSEERFRVFYQMHPLNDKRHSTINHTGQYEKSRASRCPCKNGPVCKNCGFCAGCSCKCHRAFTLHHRFMKVDEETNLFAKVENIVQTLDWRIEETTMRLMHAGKQLSCEYPVEESKVNKKEYEQEDVVNAKGSIDDVGNKNVESRMEETQVSVTSIDKSKSIDDSEIALSSKERSSSNEKEVKHIEEVKETKVAKETKGMKRLIDSIDTRVSDMINRSKPYENAPILEVTSIIKGLKVEQFRNVLNLIKKDEVLDINEFDDILPDSFQRQHLFHFYRNCQNIKEPLVEENDNISLFPREIEILAYCVFKRKGISAIHDLIPYRSVESLKDGMKSLRKMNILNNVSFKAHAYDSVRHILEWERGVDRTQV